MPANGSDGMRVGRELGGATVGVIGMPPAARSMAQMLGGVGSKVVGYDPALHGSDSVLERWRVAPLLVSIGHSALFDEAAPADALHTGRIAAAWFDSLEPGALDAGRPLFGIEKLQVTPRLASTTRESRLRSAWAVVKRIDELLTPRADPEADPYADSDADFTPTEPGLPTDFADAPGWP